jgi:predicted DNA-binding transcriptional regulator AlpA
MQRREIAPPPYLESRQLLDTASVAKISGYSVAHFRWLVRQGLAPTPIRLNGRKLGWRAGDVAAWIDSKAGA